ncbi:MAG TPA: adenylate/guanylate cyclase domain-containing protein [Candidatus Limnocylindria bacterium]|nr:adenylate/guanylate cyclase domain-containing protein [Candidatus Limnocylindria bacterium]
MTNEQPAEPPRESNDDWRDLLLGVHPDLVRFRRFFRHIPTDPRCKLCLSPYAGVGGAIVQRLGFGRNQRNPQLCNNCFRSAEKHPGGAELEISTLFADIRGSTAMAETMSAAAYSDAVSDYVRTASQAIRQPGGLVEKLLGDGIMALFIPGFVGSDRAGQAVEAARTLLRDVALPVGVGVHTGTAWVGFVGGVSDVMDFTALGDVVNVASRLGSEAGAGELLISSATAEAAHLATDALEFRRLELRGRSEPLDAWSQTITPEPAQA